MTNPFAYPTTPHVRRHGPIGYANYNEFRPWLRDEIAFRCVYCLTRETWALGGFHLDHFLPIAHQPLLATEYDNLLYCCATCNRAKSDRILPDPLAALLQESVTIDANGVLGKRKAKR